MALIYEVTDEDLEFTQDIRKRMATSIAQVNKFEQDPELANVMLSTLRDIDKQNEFRLKQKAEKESGDLDRQIAERALAIQERFAKQGVDPFRTPRDSSGVPHVDTRELPEVQFEEGVGEQFSKDADWAAFEKKMKSREE